MKKIIRLTESDLRKIVRRIVKEQVSLLALPPDIINMSTGNNNKQIKLSSVDPKTKQPLVLLYNIQGKYAGINFDVQLKNIARTKPQKNLSALVKPDSWLGYQTMVKSIPDKYFVVDENKKKWLRIEVPKVQIDKAINQLRTNSGSKAEVDAGSGVKLILSLAN